MTDGTVVTYRKITPITVLLFPILRKKSTKFPGSIQFRLKVIKNRIHPLPRLTYLKILQSHCIVAKKKKKNFALSIS